MEASKPGGARRPPEPAARGRVADGPAPSPVPSRKDLKDGALRRELGDPSVPDWRKRRIRERLGLEGLLEASELSGDLEDGDLEDGVLDRVRRAVDAHARRVGFGALPADVAALSYAFEVTAVFEDDGFRDYSDAGLEEDPSLAPDRDGLLAALRRLGLGADADRVEAVWRQDEITDGDVEALQDRYWSDAFGRDLRARTGRLVREAAPALLALDAAREGPAGPDLGPDLGPAPNSARGPAVAPPNSPRLPVTTRTETDSLGPVEVPADALYGAQTQRAKENFPISSLRFPRRFIEALGTVKAAAARANKSLGLLEDATADAIEAAALRVRSGELDAEFVLDVFQTGSGTSTNMNANEVIANAATRALGGAVGSKGVHPNDDVNMGQSSNDVIPTAMHVAARVALEEDLLPALERFADALEDKADAFDDVVKSGRTHLMDATPVRLGQEFGGYAAQVRKGIGRVEDASEELAELALGGTATGTGINRPEAFPQAAIQEISALTELTFHEATNHFEAQAAKDAYVYAAGALNTVAVSLMKIANDIRHLSSGPTSGLSEIQLPAIQPGSSIMPGKVNPVMSEAMMMVSARVMGNAVTITVGGQHGNFELNVMMPVMAHAMLESIEALSGVLDAFRERCLEGITANRERARELLLLNPSIATALNAEIGYDQASKVAKKSAAEGRSVRDVALEMGVIPADRIDEVLDVRSMTEPGIPGA